MAAHQMSLNTSLTDELASSLRCAEFLADSPSTSFHSEPSMNAVPPRRRRSTAIRQRSVLAPAQVSVVQSRKRPSLDARLNGPQHVSVRGNVGDRALHTDSRVLTNLMQHEEALAPNSRYLTAVQEEMQPQHRSQAVEWLADVAVEERCDADVLPLAVQLMDRFLSTQNIFRTDLQVLAGVCLFIASKVKAPQPLTAQRIAYYTADSVQMHDVLSWELLVLTQLEWEVSAPTGLDFLDQLLARAPQLAHLKEPFVKMLHHIQSNAKLAFLLPSLQACLCLLFVASRPTESPETRMRAEHVIATTFSVDIKLLSQYVSLMEQPVRVVLAPPSSLSSQSRTPSPQAALQPVASSIPATPHNDSGFCSAISSPDGSMDKEQLDCSPPKMARV